MNCPKCGSHDVQYLKKQKQYLCEDCDYKFIQETEQSCKRIFLSYGHGEYSNLAVQLKKDLEARGHEVWFDLERLQAGKDWEQYAEEGLKWVTADLKQGCMVFLMTPHSTRRPYGFCLNELAKAIEKGLSTVPVMIVWCEPPLSICRIQWLDMQDCLPLEGKYERYQVKLDRLCDAIVHNKIELEGALARIKRHLKPLPFAGEVLFHLSKFTGRQWLLQQVNNWLADPRGSRVFWIIGPAGIGKTAIAAWLCTHQREVVAFHLCVHNHTEKTDPRKCVISIAFQLCTQLYEYQMRLDSLNLEELIQDANAQTLFDRLIVQPLSVNFPPPDHPVAILIDGLDEATKDGGNELAQFLASEWVRTPLWLRLIITSRPDPAVRNPLQAYTPYEIDAQSPDNEKDIRLYLAEQLTDYYDLKVTPPEVINAIVARCENNFLYAHYIIDDLAKGHLSLDRLDELPQGLGGCYNRLLTRQFPHLEAYKSRARPLLELLVVAQEPLLDTFISAVLNWDDYQRRETLAAFGSLISIKEGLVRPFHRTFLDWVADETKAGPWHSISIATGHQRLATHGWKEYTKGLDYLSPYSRRHLAHHLVALNEFEKLQQFISNPEIMREQMSNAGKYNLLQLCREIGSHLDMVKVYQAALDTYEESGRQLNEVASLINLVALFFQLSAQYEAALSLFNRSLNIREQVLGPEHEDTAYSLNNLANIYQTLGKYDQAEPLYCRALSIWEKTLGLEHQFVSNALNSLGSLYQTQGKYKQAELFYQRSLSVREKALGAGHPSVAAVLDNKARLYQIQGKADQAEALHLRSLAILEKALGIEHPDTAIPLNDLATLYQAQGKFNQAEVLRQRALSVAEKALGPEHPHTAVPLNDLANLYQIQEKYEQAKSLHQRALAIWEKALGPEHFKTAVPLNDLASIYQVQGEYDKAESLGKRALAICEKVLGQGHPYTRMVKVNLSQIQKAMMSRKFEN